MTSVTKDDWARQNNEYDTVINGVISTVKDTFLGKTITVDEKFLNDLKLIWESQLPLKHQKIDLAALEQEQPLPVEIWCKIFSYLPEKLLSNPLKKASLTCKRWLKIIREDPKLSGHKVVYWHKTLKTLQDPNWNWDNWPSLKTIEFEYVENGLFPFREETMDSLLSARVLFNQCPSLEKVILNIEVEFIDFLEVFETNKLFALNPKQSCVWYKGSISASLELLLKEEKNHPLIYEDTSLKELLQIGQKTEEQLQRLVIDETMFSKMSKWEFEKNFIPRLTNQLPQFKFLTLDSDLGWKNDFLRHLKWVMHKNPKSNLFEILRLLLDKKLKKFEDLAQTAMLPELEPDDLKILTQGSWSQLWIIDFVYQMIHNELPKKIMISGQKFELLPLVVLGDVSNLQDFNYLYSKLNDLKFDGIDHLFLSLFVFLRESEPYLRNRNSIWRKQNDFLEMLQTYCIKCYPNVLGKFNQLLSVLPDIRKIAKCGENFLYNKFKETNAPTENLLYGMLHATQTFL